MTTTEIAVIVILAGCLVYVVLSQVALRRAASAAREAVSIARAAIDVAHRFESVADRFENAAQEWESNAMLAKDYLEHGLVDLHENNETLALFERILAKLVPQLETVILKRQHDKLHEELHSLEQEPILRMGKRGRKRGSLSSSGLVHLTYGSKVDDIIPFLQEAKRAQEAGDGSFAQLCKDKELPESTVRTWLKNYAGKIEGASNSS